MGRHGRLDQLGIHGQSNLQGLVEGRGHTLGVLGRDLRDVLGDLLSVSPVDLAGQWVGGLTKFGRCFANRPTCHWFNGQGILSVGAGCLHRRGQVLEGLVGGLGLDLVVLAVQVHLQLFVVREGVQQLEELVLVGGGNHACQGFVDSREVGLGGHQVGILGGTVQGFVMSSHGCLDELWVHRQARFQERIHGLGNTLGVPRRFSRKVVGNDGGVAPVNLLRNGIGGITELRCCIADGIGEGRWGSSQQSRHGHGRSRRHPAAGWWHKDRGLRGQQRHGAQDESRHNHATRTSHDKLRTDLLWRRICPKPKP
mmetsp:Transcript_14453/g.17761  ORF Transcript_14453/g.17761 Transcript_14453/m.17761 type:complete len:311 (-) Transcript_14453:21-953(-)